MRFIKKYSSLMESGNRTRMTLPYTSPIKSVNFGEPDDTKIRVLVTYIEDLEEQVDILEELGLDFKIYMKPSKTKDSKNDQYYIVGRDLETFHFDIMLDKFGDYYFGNVVDYRLMIQANKYNL